MHPEESDLSQDSDQPSQEKDDADAAEPSQESEQPSSSGSEIFPNELETALKETDVFVTQAKKQRAEIEKARGFFKGGNRDPKSKEEHMKKCWTLLLKLYLDFQIMQE